MLIYIIYCNLNIYIYRFIYCTLFYICIYILLYIYILYSVNKEYIYIKYIILYISLCCFRNITRQWRKFQR